MEHKLASQSGPGKIQSGGPSPAGGRRSRAPARPLLELRRKIGNRAFGQILQRKCTECEEERSEEPPLRPKLQVSAPDDASEREADQVAEEVMRTPDVRPPEGAADVGAAVRGGGGRPLSHDARAFFEPYFGHDLGGVRIHDDATAHESARAIGAQAFTWRNDIFFGQSAYHPETTAGRGLIAHELTHSLQQGGGSPRGASPGAFPVQRKVSPDWPKIEHNLTRRLFLDWVVTDAEAHEVLMLLKSLGDQDLRDTVAEMEKQGLVDTLFGNVSDADQAKETATLERINEVRVRTGKVGGKQVTVVGSCTPERTEEIDSRIATTKDWAKRSREKVAAFIADPAKQPGVAAFLDRHFFHQTWAGTLPAAVQISKAGQIRDNFEKVEKQATPFTLACAGAFDLLCGALAAAYVSQARRRVVFCPTFFDSSAIWKTYALFHELVHAHASVDDRGYGSERVFLHLPPDAAINNADSYALFTMDALAIEKGAESVRHVRRPEEDEFSDCSPANTRTLQSDFAFATRMITNARNVIGDPTLAVDLLDKHFKTHDPQELQRIVERLKKIDEKFGKMNFECESSCDPNIVGYYRTWGWTVHVCPPYFAMASAEGREDELLLLAIREELGLPRYLRPTDAAYARQSKDDAHGNPAAYAAYARDVSKRFFP